MATSDAQIFAAARRRKARCPASHLRVEFSEVAARRLITMKSTARADYIGSSNFAASFPLAANTQKCPNPVA